MQLRSLTPLLLTVFAACSAQRVSPSRSVATSGATSIGTPAATLADDHSAHTMPAAVAPRSGSRQAQQDRIAPGALDAAARLQASTRHAEWAMIPTAPGSTDSIAAYVVFPERRDKAPVVVVVHEIFGLSTWVRSVADQLAADGFIAIAPDLLSIERGGATTDSLAYDQARAMIRNVTPDKMNAMVAAVGRFGMSLPAASKKYGVVGYCWGGSAAFNHAVFNAPGMSASVAYYGSAPVAAEVAKIKIPVLGLYGENDQRVNATIAATDSTMKAIGGNYVSRIFPGAGHGFLRQQEVPANADASKQAWPETVAWFRKYLK